MMTQTPEAPANQTTHRLEVDGAVLTYDVREAPGKTQPPLMLIGSPMAAAGFGTLATHFSDRTIITYDPRGSERSVKSDPSTQSTPEHHAEDVHRIIEATGLGSVDLFATSGGAVNALALVARHPDDVLTLVAHEPPLASQLPDRDEAKAVVRAINKTYQERGFGAAMAHFIAVVGHKGEFPAGFANQPAPDPQLFGMPAEDDGSRDDVMLQQNIVTCSHYEPDYEALLGAPTRIVIAAGEESEGEMARRGAEAVAARLNLPIAIFPSGHGGFLGGEYGQNGQPAEFAVRLREVLAE